MEKKKMLTAEQIEDAKRLKALFESKKKQLKITQYTLADEIGISQGAVGHYLNGRIALNTRAASIFAHFLKVSVSDFSPTLAKLIAKQASSLQGEIVDNNDQSEKGSRLSSSYLTDEQIELLQTFESLPDDKKEKFLREMKAMKAHYDAYFEQRLKNTHGKAS